jgi:hypothetical protein
VSIEWDNWSNKTIVNNNMLLPPPLQSSKLRSSKEMHLHVETMCLFVSKKIRAHKCTWLEAKDSG